MDGIRRRAAPCQAAAGAAPDMGLAPGGRMRQTIYDDHFDLSDWETNTTSRCFVHIANSMVWESITGKQPPTVPPTAKQYSKAGLPWFEYYGEGKAVEPSSILNKLKSVVTLGKEKGHVPLPENEAVDPKNVVALRAGLKKGQIREGSF